MLSESHKYRFYIRCFGRPVLFSTGLAAGRRRGNSYCTGRAIAMATDRAAEDALLVSLLTDCVSTSVPPSKCHRHGIVTDAKYTKTLHFTVQLHTCNQSMKSNLLILGSGLGGHISRERGLSCTNTRAESQT